MVAMENSPDLQHVEIVSLQAVSIKHTYEAELQLIKKT